MRKNRSGIPYFRAVPSASGFKYYWLPPKALWKARIFRFVTLGTDLNRAKAEANQWNKKLDAYYVVVHGKQACLECIKPMTAGFIVRSFEASSKFSRYSART